MNIKDLPEPEPFLGRIMIKIIKEDSNNYLKEKLKGDLKEKGKNVSEDFLNKFEILQMEDTVDAVTGQNKATIVKKRVPYSKGIIVKKAPDAFGKAFTEKFGDVGYTPTYGDTLLFIPNETFRIDPADTYHFINDCDIVGYIKAKEVVNEC